MLPRDAELGAHGKAADPKEQPITQSNELLIAVFHVAFSWTILTVQDLQVFASNHPPCLYMGEKTEVLNTCWNCTQLGCGFFYK